MALVLAFISFFFTQPSSVQATEFQLKAYHGKQRTVERAKLRVPADYQRRDGRTVEIAFYRFRAKQVTPAPPIVFLMGGPGIPATVLAPIPPYFDLFDRLSETADVIVLDQRGIGESVPKVDCPPLAAPLALDVFESKARLLAAFQSVNSACVEHWRKASIEPTDLAIEQVADDVESLRVALDAKQVDLLAFSYGTRLAMEVLRRHSGIVRRVVLQGVLENTIRMPAMDDQIFRALASISNRQAAAKGFDADLEQSLRAMQAKLSQTPLRITVQSASGKEITVTLSREVFDALIASRLGDRRLPALLTAAHRGDMTILTQWLQGMYQDLEKGSAPLLRTAMICSAAEDKSTVQAAQSQAPKSLLGDPFDNLQQSQPYCRALGFTGGPSKRPRMRLDIPALFISGSLDHRTPPARAEEVRKNFLRSEHVVVRNGGHELLPEPKVQDLVVNFFAGRVLGNTTIDLPDPVFPDLDSAKEPPRRPQ